jgi:hypothetical protein
MVGSSIRRSQPKSKKQLRPSFRAGLQNPYGEVKHASICQQCRPEALHLICPCLRRAAIRTRRSVRNIELLRRLCSVVPESRSMECLSGPRRWSVRVPGSMRDKFRGVRSLQMAAVLGPCRVGKWPAGRQRSWRSDHPACARSRPGLHAPIATAIHDLQACTCSRTAVRS